MEQLEEVQQALWNADFMKVPRTGFLSKTRLSCPERLQDCSEFQEAKLKDKFLRGYLASALEGICRVMAKNRTMYLVGDKVHCSPRATVRLPRPLQVY